MAVEDIFTFGFKYFCQTVMLLVQLTFECQFRPIIFLLKGKISKYPYFVNYYYTYFLEQVLDCTNKDLFHVLYIHSFIHLFIQSFIVVSIHPARGKCFKKVDTQQCHMLIEFTDFYIMPKLEEFAHYKTNTLFGFSEQILNILKGFQ